MAGWNKIADWISQLSLSRGAWGRTGLDVLDVVLVALVVYHALRLVKGTRAMQIATGLGLVFLAHQVARRLELVTLYTLLDTVLTSSVLLVVVLFQNDIRRALANMGQNRLFAAGRTKRDEQAIGEVVKACKQLALRRIGALIVFERDASLDEFVHQGTRLDAVVSEELVYSLFVPSHENPLHDGAMIIREGRVHTAGVFLPLSGQHRLDRAFGTRHRAAMGLTEETDAVVVVVSEERGVISLCFNGNLVQRLDADSLEKSLLSLFRTHKAKKNRESRTIRNSLLPPATTSSRGPSSKDKRNSTPSPPAPPGMIPPNPLPNLSGPNLSGPNLSGPTSNGHSAGLPQNMSATGQSGVQEAVIDGSKASEESPSRDTSGERR